MSGGDWIETYTACQKGDLELVKYHIENGIDLNYMHPEILTTFLMESIRSGHLSITEYLLENGANIMIKDYWTGETAISIAEKLKDKSFINLLNSRLK